MERTSPAPPCPRARRTEARSTARGVAAILGATFLLSFSDALVSLASDRLALGQLLVVRSGLAVLMILVLAHIRLRSSQLRLLSPGWVWLRSVLLTVMWLAYYSALPSVPLSLAAAALYTAPLFMAVFARVMLDEAVGGAGWIAIAIGLTGVLFILRPSITSASALIALPFVAAASYALAAIVTRSRCGDESSNAMALNLNLSLLGGGGILILIVTLRDPAVSMVAAFPFLLRPWPPLTTPDWLLLGLLAIFMVVIARSVAHAYQVAPGPLIGVFDNAYLVFALGWAGVLLDERLEAASLIGVLLIAAAAAMTFFSRPGKEK